MRAKPLSLGGIALSGALALLAGSQTWVSFMLDGTHSVETVTGHEINAALSPVSIAIIAAALALTIAGPVFRRVLGGLVALLGAGLVALTATAVVSPAAAISGRVTELTGIAGDDGAGVIWSSLSGWAWAGAAAGVLAAVLGIAVIVTGGRWGVAGRKYDSAAKPTRAEGAPDRISDWDSLSEGGDPTSSD
ncbi:Trp biosynthesis-associated membrane protein [Leucobacter tenebrionis]|uniref:Trp biosynthesis-associated membrane protein n=1 Tax=Leucobacter tenebrionis TaxID=2873270 RepID=UPI001CA6F46F|nr:Trp biosynthesis-associated membrane protein [Leucobacter tenebrionis]QZY51918.1 Trp biosynthesis-associated membrane protein [Leucobacter tenebrionis]